MKKAVFEILFMLVFVSLCYIGCNTLKQKEIQDKKLNTLVDSPGLKKHTRCEKFPRLCRAVKTKWGIPECVVTYRDTVIINGKNNQILTDSCDCEKSDSLIKSFLDEFRSKAQ